MAFDPQPTLSGDLVEVRPLVRDDREALLAVASDPLIWEQHPVPDRWKVPEFERFFAESLASGGALTVVDRRTAAVIGSSRYRGYDSGPDEVEIGWTFLARSHWGGAYNGELKRLMLRHAFRYVDRVVFLVGPDNVRSRRAVERIGASRVGRRPDGGGRDSLVYEITASTFSATGSSS